MTLSGTFPANIPNNIQIVVEFPVYYDGSSPWVYYSDENSVYAGTTNTAYSYNFASLSGTNSSTSGTSTLVIKNVYNGALISAGTFNMTIRNITYPFSLSTISGITVWILDSDGSQIAVSSSSVSMFASVASTGSISALTCQTPSGGTCIV